MEAALPRGALVEYDVQLTGVVTNMRIVTLEDASSDADPLQSLVDMGKRLPGTLARLAALVGAVKPK